MRRSGIGSVALVAALGLQGLAAALSSGGGFSDLDIKEKFDLMRWSLQDLNIDPAPYADVTFEVELGGVTYLLGMLNDPIRSKDYQAFIVDDQGMHPAEEIDGEMAPCTTYKGDVVDPATGYSLGRVGGSVYEGQFSGVAWIEHEDGTRETFWIQPLTDGLPDAPKTAHLVYKDEDVIRGGEMCGADMLPDFQRDQREKEFDNGDDRDGGDKLFEIGLDCDFQFYQYNNSNFKATQRDAEKIVANCEIIYERDVDISWEIRLIIVRQSSGGDPYTSNDAGTLLDQFHDYWCANYAYVGRDTAHLMTGNNINGGIVGIAYLGVICAGTSCSQVGYGLSWLTWTSNLTTRVGLVSHEVGHNWNAGHCDGKSDCSIMCSSLGGCSGDLTKFGASEQTQIENFRNSRGCLTNDVNPITLPYFDDFPSTTIDVNKWSYNLGCNINTQANNEPSAPNSLRFNAIDSLEYNDDQIRTNEINMSGAGTVNLSYYLEWRQTEGTEKLFSQGYVAARAFVNLITHTADAITQDNFTFHSIDLQTNMVHSYGRLRFRAECEANDDYFFVDNVSIVDTGFMKGDRDGGLVRPGDRFRLRVIGPKPGTAVSLFLSLSGGRIDPNQIKHKKRLELVGSIVPLGQVISDSQGVGTFDFALPPDLPPGKAYVQAVIWDSKFTTGHEATNFEIIEIK